MTFQLAKAFIDQMTSNVFKHREVDQLLEFLRRGRGCRESNDGRDIKRETRPAQLVPTHRLPTLPATHPRISDFVEQLVLSERHHVFV